MEIAVLTFESFNEIDSFVATAMLNRVPGWHAYITGATDRVTSKGGAVIQVQRLLEFAGEADAVIIGSGMSTSQVVADAGLLARIRLDPARQLIASQCSGALILEKLGLLAGNPAATDLLSAPSLGATGTRVLEVPFHAVGNVASAGGCLASQYIATWMIARRLGRAEAERVLHAVAPVGEKEEYISRALAAVEPYLVNSHPPIREREFHANG